MPLPLTLISFTAKYGGDFIALSWVTVDEENVDHFTVERSDDGISFYSIAQLPARNSGNRETYSIKDYKRVDQTAYYRLRMTDIDAKEKLSRIVMVTVLDESKGLALLTNPAHDKISLLTGNDLNGIFDYSINSMNGQLMQQGKLEITNGGNYELPLKQSLMKGIYSLEVKNNLQSFHFTFIRQ